MTFSFLINLGVFVILLFLILKSKKQKWSGSLRVMLGLALGLIFGSVLQIVYGIGDRTLLKSVEWFNIVGSGYISLLQMIVMPLIFISIVSAIANVHSMYSVGTMSVIIITILLVTTSLSALVGILVIHFFGLTAKDFLSIEPDIATILGTHISQLEDMSIPKTILSIIPQNPFAELTGAKRTSIMGVVIFATFLGAAVIRLRQEDRDRSEIILSFIQYAQSWVMSLVRIIVSLAPYGVFALMIKVGATSDITEMFKLLIFIIASYVGIVIMVSIHSMFLGLSGINPFSFFKKVIPVLAFAFSSRSSAASIPLNIAAQTQKIGVPQAIASLSASLGSIIGQNGCAGLYPAMISAMIAPSVGINPLDPVWLITLVCVVTLSSVGVAGVGGGAIFSALIVLPVMGLPISLLAVLMSVEPLIDMGRTALNVSGSMLAGTITSQVLHTTDKSIFKG